MLKLLFYCLMFGFIVFLNLGLYLPSRLAVDEADIGKNINTLKKQKWFRDYLENELYRDLIVHDNDVRKVIGRLNGKHIQKGFYANMHQKRLQHILEKKSNRLI